MSEEPVISTKDRPGDFDAIETAKPGEPLFALQGGDPHAPPTVMHWVGLFRAAAMQETDDEKRAAMLRKATSAEAVAWAMQDYQRVTADSDREAAAEQARVDQDEPSANLARLADRLYNALAEASAVAEALEGAGGHLSAVASIWGAAELLKMAAADFEPRRHLRGAGA